jgi:hypothetical protein
VLHKLLQLIGNLMSISVCASVRASNPSTTTGCSTAGRFKTRMHGGMCTFSESLLSSTTFESLQMPECAPSCLVTQVRYSFLNLFTNHMSTIVSIYKRLMRVPFAAIMRSAVHARLFAVMRPSSG